MSSPPPPADAEPAEKKPRPPPLQPLMRQNFLEYASYVIVDRAIPDERDGLKPVQRRILATLFAADDGKFHKVANIIGETMKLHPHGDASIGEALVVLANKEYFIEKQGNFGNVITGHSAAAARYIECRLTPLAKRTLFHPALTQVCPSYDGRRQEPVFLPAKLPVALMLGTEGIAVGMATKILPHNFRELIAAQVAFLEERKFKLLPDFPHGGHMDASEYADGLGRVRLRAVVSAVGERKIVIREIPFSTTCESLIASIEAGIARGKVKVASIHDFTTDKVEIELTCSRGATAEEVVLELFAYTDCEVSVSCNLVVIADRHPKQQSVGALLGAATLRLRRQIGAELEHELGQWTDRMHRLTLEQIFIEKKVYQAIEQKQSLMAVRAAVAGGMAAFAKHFVRPLVDDDVDRLLELHIRRISVYDVAQSRAQLKKIEAEIAGCRAKLADLTGTTVAYLKDLDARFGSHYPRRTKVKRFTAVDRRAIARADIRLVYDPASGFVGPDLKGAGTTVMTVSEFDLTLAVSEDGTFRVLGPQAKVLVGKLALWLPFDPEVGARLAAVWRDAKQVPWGKSVTIERFVRGRAYRLLPGEGATLAVLRALPMADDTPPPAASLAVGPAAPEVATPRVRLTAARRKRGAAAEEVVVRVDALAEASLGGRGQKLAAFALGAVQGAAGRRGRS